MIKRNYLYLSLVFFMGNIGAFGHEDIKIAAKKPLTILVYVAADNSLNAFADYNLKQAMAVGSTDKLNILFYVNVKTDTQPKVTRKLFVHKGGVTQDGPDTVRDSGSEKTLIEACTWALTSYPSDQFALILWDHGSGAINIPSAHRSVCFDDTTGNNLTDEKMVIALKYIVNVLRNGKKIDVIAFDACLEAGIEVLDTLVPYADYVVASEETIADTGYNYDYAFRAPALSKLNSEQLAIQFVKAYKANYIKSKNGYTLSASKMSNVTNLSKNIDQVAMLLQYHLQGPDAPVMYDILVTNIAPGTTVCFYEPAYLDLYDLYQNLIISLQKKVFVKIGAQQRLIDALKNGLSLIKKVVIANVTSDALIEAQGISIYFPQPNSNIDPGYMNTIWAKKSLWYQFLQTYVLYSAGRLNH